MRLNLPLSIFKPHKYWAHLLWLGHMPICQLIIVARRKGWDNWLGLALCPSTPRLEYQEIQMENGVNDDDNNYSCLSHLIHKNTLPWSECLCPPKIYMLKLKANRIFGSGAFGRYWSHNSGALMNEMNALIKETPEISLVLLPGEDTKPGSGFSPDTESAGILILDSPAFRTIGSKYRCLKGTQLMAFHYRSLNRLRHYLWSGYY